MSHTTPTNSSDHARQSLYVSGLPWATTSDEVHELFGRYGDVHEATIITNRRTGRSRGFGFVEMTRPAADTALGALNGSKIDGRALTVKLALPRGRASEIETLTPAASAMVTAVSTAKP